MSNFLDKTGLSYFWSSIKKKFIRLNGGGTATMSDTLGSGPYEIIFTEEGDGGDITADLVEFDGSGTDILATDVQAAIKEVHAEIQPISKGGTGVNSMTGSDYSTNRPRGIILQETEPTSVPDGCIVGVYE